MTGPGTTEPTGSADPWSLATTISAMAQLRTAQQAGDTEAVLAAVNRMGGELATSMGIRITEYTPERVVGTMPVVGNRQPFGLLHGGANGALAESLGSFHAALLVPDDTIAVGTELSCTHHRSATEGVVTGVSVPLHVGRSMGTFEIVISDEQGRRICTARLSGFFRPAPVAR